MVENRFFYLVGKLWAKLTDLSSSDLFFAFAHKKSESWLVA